MVQQIDADGTWECTPAGVNGAMGRQLNTPSQAQLDKNAADLAAMPEVYRVCVRTTLVSGKSFDTETVTMNDLTVADIDELIDAGKTVIRLADDQEMTHS
jgi:hypothetical protein